MSDMRNNMNISEDDFEEDPLEQISNELQELGLDPNDESIWDDIINTDVVDILRQYSPRKAMRETGVIEVIERDGVKYLSCIDEELGKKEEFEFISIQADKYPTGTQFVIYEPK